MKKIIYKILIFILILISCQKEDDSSKQELQNLEHSIESRFNNQQLFNNKGTSIDGKVIGLNKIDALAVCEDCEVTLELSSTSSGATAQVTIVDSSGTVVFSQVVSSQTAYTFMINSCESYNVTTQLLTGTKGNIQIRDGKTKYSIPAGSNAVTYQNYSFVCPVDEVVEECTITICVRFLSGTANAVHLGIFINGSLPGAGGTFFNLQDGDCFDFVINENDTYEIRHIASNPSSDFAFSLQIDAQNYNLGYYMQGNSDTTGLIPSQYLQCEE